MQPHINCGPMQARSLSLSLVTSRTSSEFTVIQASTSYHISYTFSEDLFNPNFQLLSFSSLVFFILRSLHFLSHISPHSTITGPLNLHLFFYPNEYVTVIRVHINLAPYLISHTFYNTGCLVPSSCLVPAVCLIPASFFGF